MNINDLTLGQIKDLQNILGNSSQSENGLNSQVGEKVIIRTYSAGVHYGLLSEKCGTEVILKDARRLYYWKTKGGVSLSEVAKSGLHDDSRVCCAVDNIWLDAIEIIPCSDEAIESIEGKNDYKA